MKNFKLIAAGGKNGTENVINAKYKNRKRINKMSIEKRSGMCYISFSNTHNNLSVQSRRGASSAAEWEVVRGRRLL